MQTDNKSFMSIDDKINAFAIAPTFKFYNFIFFKLKFIFCERQFVSVTLSVKCEHFAYTIAAKLKFKYTRIKQTQS